MASPNLSSSVPEQLSRRSGVKPVSRVLIIGNRGESNVGSSFERSALELDLSVELLESKEAMQGPTWLRKVNWHLRGHTPTRLAAFNQALTATCASRKPDILLTTGLAPVSESALRDIQAMGIVTANYLTDDPWNPAHRASWFFRALRQYDYVFTPRRANMADLRGASDAVLSFLPFGYDPTLFFQPTLDPAERAELDADVIFAGGGDADRAPFIGALTSANMKVALYGTYWERYPETKALARGQLGISKLRNATAAARLVVCLVRRANRDGHCMRTFEAPAIGTCMLTEDTEEHREIFGGEGDATVYFRSAAEMVEKARWLLDNHEERRRLAAAAHQLIVGNKNTYKDRLTTILQTISAGRPRT